MIDRDELINSWEIFRDEMFSSLTGNGKQIMPDREKVIKGLKHCDFGVSSTCYENECPYYQSHNCTDELKNDILALLKEQETTFEKDGHHIRCLSCGEYWCDRDREGDLYPMNFCPNCGRKVK